MEYVQTMRTNSLHGGIKAQKIVEEPFLYFQIGEFQVVEIAVGIVIFDGQVAALEQQRHGVGEYRIRIGHQGRVHLLVGNGSEVERGLFYDLHQKRRRSRSEPIIRDVFAIEGIQKAERVKDAFFAFFAKPVAVILFF